MQGQGYIVDVTSLPNPVFAERERKRPPPWTLPAHGFLLAPLPYVGWMRKTQ